MIVIVVNFSYEFISKNLIIDLIMKFYSFFIYHYQLIFNINFKFKKKIIIVAILIQIIYYWFWSFHRSYLLMATSDI